MYIKEHRFFLLIVFAISVLSCKQSIDDAGLQYLKGNAFTDSITMDMMDVVNQSYQKVNPENISYYLNKKRSEILRQLSKEARGSKKIELEIKSAMELLNSGDTKQAIEWLEDIKNRIIESSLSLTQENLISFNRNLAIAYLRLGEEVNCIQRANQYSCILPFECGGLHSDLFGAINAIRILEENLSIDSEDKESFWLHSIATSSIGENASDFSSIDNILDSQMFSSEIDFPRFNNVAELLNVDVSGLSGGVCMDDFNNDGNLDLIVSSWGFFDQLKYLVNSGDGNFIDYTDSSGLIGISGGLNMVHADYNNDGFNDVLVLRGAWFKGEGKIPNSLLRNNGDNTFTDVTREVGLLSYHPTQTAAWSDFNNDGWLDILICNETDDQNINPIEFYINNKGNGFIDIAPRNGFAKISGYIKGCVAGDVNNDGWADIYISRFQKPNLLLINQGPTGSGLVFKSFDQPDQVAEPVKSFPCWMWDFNNDGWLDIFVSGYGSGDLSVAREEANNHLGVYGQGHPRIYKNIGGVNFKEVSSEMGVRGSYFTMGCNFGDIDNDGYEDFYLGTGDPNFSSIVPNRMFKNENGNEFIDVTYAGGFGHIQKGHAIAFGDIDNDGDQEIYAVMGGSFEGDLFQNALFDNNGDFKNNWITLRLEGVKSNRNAIGARIKITATGDDGVENIFYRWIGTGGSFGASSLQAEIGIGKLNKIKELEIRWPNPESSVQHFLNLDINSVYKIKENSIIQKLESFEL